MVPSEIRNMTVEAFNLVSGIWRMDKTWDDDTSYNFIHSLRARI